MQKKEIERIYIKKINELKKHNKAYFENDNPLISDKKYKPKKIGKDKEMGPIRRKLKGLFE